MSTKRNKKNVVDTSTNNNYKKSKNTITVGTNDDACDNVKIKKKENAAVFPNNKKVTIGNKRKLSESDVSPTPKKTKKRGKLFTNSIIEPAENLPCKPSSTLNTKKESKKSKKKNKLPLNNEECFINNTTSNTFEPLVQKVGKKKKSSKDKISDDHVGSVVQIDDALKEEIDSKNCDEINVQKNNFEHENVSKNEQCLENGSIHLPVKDLGHSQSNINETQLFPELVKKAENAESK